MRPYLFIGPTAADIPTARLAPFVCLPPVEAGAVAALAGAPPGTLILVDGNLEPGRALEDAELLAALAAGWRVIGLASVGALKAAALSHAGVIGFGFVARYARLFPQRAQDEIAALYFPTPPYAPASEPLLELRLLLKALIRRGIAPPQAAREMALHFRAAPLEGRTVEEVVRRYPKAREVPSAEWRLKREDLLAFLQADWSAIGSRSASSAFGSPTARSSAASQRTTPLRRSSPEV